VDIERIRAVADLAALVRTSFAAEEQIEFWRLPESMRVRALFVAWTRKEAFVKATGEGLSRSLSSFALSVAPYASPRLLRVDEDCNIGDAWKVVDLTSDPKIAAAVAVPEAGVHVLTHELHPQMLGQLPRD
jgi:4'-phosphopantetheinyl transferase